MRSTTARSRPGNRWLGMLFSRRFVLQLRAGNKTQTRRFRTLAAPGDLLWVRETWAPAGQGFLYAADFDAPSSRSWRPSIHMQLPAARTWLRVVRVWCERLDELDDAGARADGFESRSDFLAYWRAREGPSSYSVIEFVPCEPPRLMQQLAFDWESHGHRADISL